MDIMGWFSYEIVFTLNGEDTIQHCTFTIEFDDERPVAHIQQCTVELTRAQRYDLELLIAEEGDAAWWRHDLSENPGDEKYDYYKNEVY